MHTGLMHTLLRHIVSHLAIVQNLDSFQTIFIYFHRHQKYVIGGYRIHHVDRSYVLSTSPPFYFFYFWNLRHLKTYSRNWPRKRLHEGEWWGNLNHCFIIYVSFRLKGACVHVLLLGVGGGYVHKTCYSQSETYACTIN